MRLSSLSSAASTSKVRTVIEFANTSCTQRTEAAGETASSASRNRRSWLSRGRNMARCSPNRTGRR